MQMFHEFELCSGGVAQILQIESTHDAIKCLAEHKVAEVSDREGHLGEVGSPRSPNFQDARILINAKDRPRLAHQTDREQADITRGIATSSTFMPVISLVSSNRRQANEYLGLYL